MTSLTRHGECQPEKCGSACCRLLSILDYKDDDNDKYLEFYRARGITVADRDVWQVLNIPHVCPQLHEGKCLVQTAKPQACTDYPEHPNQLLPDCTYTFTDDSTD